MMASRNKELLLCASTTTNIKDLCVVYVNLEDIVGSGAECVVSFFKIKATRPPYGKVIERDIGRRIGFVPIKGNECIIPRIHGWRTELRISEKFPKPCVSTCNGRRLLICLELKIH